MKKNVRYYAKDQVGDGIRELEEHKISTWRNVFETDGYIKSFVTIDPSERYLFFV